MPEMKKTAPPESDKRKRMRSPAYPYVNLETAIKRAKEFYDKEQRNAAALKVAVKHWGYEEKSSGGPQTAAALISFGLMQDEGIGEKRKVRLTDTALRIILDNRSDSQDRAVAIRAAALMPKIHKQLWKRWGTALPSDDNLKHTLQLDWTPPFNPAAVDGFIREYRDTIAFAKPDSSDTVSIEDDESDHAEDEETENGSTQVHKPRTGDYVQWVSQGIEQFRRLKKVVGFTDDGKYAFLDGEKTAAPVEELEIGEPPATPPPFVPHAGSSVRRRPQEGNTAMRQDVFSLDNGGEVTISWPVPLTEEMITDIKDWLKIVERKISRSTEKPTNQEE